MGSNSAEEASLSDFEDDDFASAAVEIVSPSPNSNSNVNLKEVNQSFEDHKALAAELEAEKRALKSSKAEVDLWKSKFQSVQKEMASKMQRKEEEFVRVKEELGQQLSQTLRKLDEAVKQKDDLSKEMIKQKDDLIKQKEEIVKQKDVSRGEIEAVARLLVTEHEKILVMVSEIKRFTGPLIRTSKSTGIMAIADGFVKRIEEVLEEVMKQREAAIKNRTAISEQMEQRNYQIAIEVSQMEATISQLKDELGKREGDLERCQKLVAEKDQKILEIEKEMSSRVEKVKKEARVAESKIRVLEKDLEVQKNVLIEQYKALAEAQENLCMLFAKIQKEVQKEDQKEGQKEGTLQPRIQSLQSLDVSDVQGIHSEYLAGIGALSDIAIVLANSWEEKEDSRQRQIKYLESEVERLARKEADVTALLRSALAGNIAAFDADAEVLGKSRDEAIALASVLESDVKRLREEIMQLQKLLAESRSEVDKLRVMSLGQTKDLATKATLIKDLKERERIESENIKGLTSELAAAEEELARWKDAATQEAAAGVAVMQEVEKCNQEIAALNQHIEELKVSLEEARGKLQSKEEMAAAAISARNAAERSLRLADERTAEIRERMEEMARQLVESESRIENHQLCAGNLLELCCPWVHARALYNFTRRQPTHQAEMEELMEPLV